MAVAVPPFPIARFSVEQYHRMIESGAFTEHDRLELIDGWVIRKMAKGAAHEFSLGQIEEFIRSHLPSGWHVRNQAPITLARSEPEPDLTVARGRRWDYRDHHPEATEVALVVEVLDTTLATDRLKGRTYAGAGIAEYWIVNLVSRCIEVHRDPISTNDGEAHYREHEMLRDDDEIHLMIDGQRCASTQVRPLLP